MVRRRNRTINIAVSRVIRATSRSTSHGPRAVPGAKARMSRGAAETITVHGVMSAAAAVAVGCIRVPAVASVGGGRAVSASGR